MSENSEYNKTPEGYTITRNIPFQIRWKIMNMKLLLFDLKELRDKYGVENANLLYEIVRDDINNYILELASLINKRKKIIAEIR